MMFRSPPRKRLSSEQRMKLYLSECERSKLLEKGEYPICNLCGLQVKPPQQWDVSHDAHLPHAMGGNEVAIAHTRCNRLHGCTVVSPLMAKLKRIRKKHLDIHRSSQPMPGGKDSDRYRKVSGEVVLRSTGQRP